MRATTRLRELLRQPGLIVAPGAYECISAKLVEAAGFACCYMTGSGTAATRLGKADVGLTTLNEMAGNARAMAEAIEIPLIADADTGFGNAINVMRAVREYEVGGVAAIHLEDQVLPKKCGHFEGKQVVGREEFAGKIRAAVEARRDPEFVIIARTDAIAVAGEDEAIARAEDALEAGADVLFIEALESVEQMARVNRHFAGRAALLANLGNGEGKTPLLTVAQAAELGFKVAIFPWSCTLNIAAKAMADALEVLKTTGSVAGLSERQYGWRRMTALLGLQEVYELERRYGVSR
jgi:2,3-dimethylmalate lyase